MQLETACGAGSKVLVLHGLKRSQQQPQGRASRILMNECSTWPMQHTVWLVSKAGARAGAAAVASRIRLLQPAALKQLPPRQLKHSPFRRQSVCPSEQRDVFRCNSGFFALWQSHGSFIPAARCKIAALAALG